MRNRKEEDSLKIIISKPGTGIDQFLVIDIVADIILNVINTKNGSSKKNKPEITPTSSKPVSRIPRNIRVMSN